MVASISRRKAIASEQDVQSANFSYQFILDPNFSTWTPKQTI